MNDTPNVDGRRRTWIKADVFYYPGSIGKGLRDNFGLEGVVCFDAFLRACKVSPVEGQIRYANAEQFLVIVGLDPITWTNDAGNAWALDELWKWLGSRHMTATRRQNGLTTVESRRWDDWQTRRSKPKNATQKRQRYDVDAHTEIEKESEKENPPSPPTTDADTEAFLVEVWNLYARLVVSRTKDVRDEDALMSSVVAKASEQKRGQVLTWLDRYNLSPSQIACALLDGVPGSWNNFVRQTPRLKVVSA